MERVCVLRKLFIFKSVIYGANIVLLLLDLIVLDSMIIKFLSVLVFQYFNNNCIFNNCSEFLCDLFKVCRLLVCSFRVWRQSVKILLYRYCVQWFFLILFVCEVGYLSYSFVFYSNFGRTLFFFIFVVWYSILNDLFIGFGRFRGFSIFVLYVLSLYI